MEFALTDYINYTLQRLKEPFYLSSPLSITVDFIIERNK